MKTKETAGKIHRCFIAFIIIGLFILPTSVFADSHKQGDMMKKDGAMKHDGMKKKDGAMKHDGMMKKHGGMMMKKMPSGDLTDEQMMALNAEKKAFFKETRDIKQEIKAKTLELRAALAPKMPDARKAMIIQKELSYLNAKLDQMGIDHFMKVKKIDPYVMFMPKGKGMMKKGRGMKKGMGMMKKGRGKKKPCMMMK